MGRFDLPRMVEEFRRAGGNDVAKIAERSYSGDTSVTAEEWDRVFRLFGPWVPGDEEQARKIINRSLNPFGMKLLCGFNVLDQLSSIECPTLVCVGDLDPATPVAASREIVEAMPAERARLAVIEGAGHFPWRDAPDRYWPLVTEFIAAMTVTGANSKPSARGRGSGTTP